MVVSVLIALCCLWLVSPLLSHAEDVLCRRCGATLSSHSNALQEKEAPPHSESTHWTQTDADRRRFGNVVQARNKLGQNFELAMFKTANVRTIPTSRSVQDSFFPGYAWRIAECPVCGAFLGWAFDRPALCQGHHHDHDKTSIENNDPNSKPKGDDKDAGLDTVLDKAFNLCLTKTLGYWSVEWCYKKQVTQYHIPGPSLKRDPEYSLGKFQSSREVTIDGELGRRYIEHKYTDGKRCDETNAGRSTTVKLTCCAAYQQHQAAGVHHHFAFLESFREPSVCNYELTVCTPLLCVDPRFAKPDPSLFTAGGKPQAALADETVCASGNPPQSSPRWFYGFDTSSLVCETDAEMIWTRTLRPMIGTGHMA